MSDGSLSIARATELLDNIMGAVVAFATHRPDAIPDLSLIDPVTDQECWAQMGAVLELIAVFMDPGSRTDGYWYFEIVGPTVATPADLLAAQLIAKWMSGDHVDAMLLWQAADDETAGAAGSCLVQCAGQLVRERPAPGAAS